MKKIEAVIIGMMVLSFMMMAIACQNPDTPVNEGEENLVEKKAEIKEKATERPAEWSYQGDLSPEYWAGLTPAYNLCGKGKSQSPINIEKKSEAGKQNWSFNYASTDLHISFNEHMHDIIDNGHTIQVNVDEGSHYKYDDTEYELKQFHFHTPSEHTIDGKNLPMEVHFVHQSADGKLAVVSGLFIENDVPNSALTFLIEHLPQTKGEEKHPEDAEFHLGDHLPKQEKVYTYLGSLTTPPCSENVRWVVLSEMIEATPDQIQAFSSVIGQNNRPVQKTNDREIKVIKGVIDNK